MSAPSLKNRPSVPPIIRLAHPLAFGAFLTRIGAPARRHFRRNGLPAHCDDPNAFVPLRAAWAAFDSAARAEDNMLGWHVGQYVGDNNLHAALIKRIEYAPTLYRGLQELIRFVSSEASDRNLGIMERDEDVLFYTHYPELKNMRGYASSQAYQLPVYLSVIRHYLGHLWVPEEIGIELNHIPAAAQACFPGTRIVPRQDMGYIVLPRSVLGTPPPEKIGSNETTELVLTKDYTVADRLRIMLRPYLNEGIPNAQIAARLMDTSTRTLARRLAESGQTYRAILDELHYHSARELLGNSNKSIKAIALTIGYDDPSHFTRMFRRISGMTPSQYRSLNCC